MKRERHNLEECGRIRVWYSALKKETLSIRNGIVIPFLFLVAVLRLQHQPFPELLSQLC